MKLVEQAYQDQLYKYPSEHVDRFLVFGLSKGVVVFVAVDQLDLIYARFFFHRQAIT